MNDCKTRTTCRLYIQCKPLKQCASNTREHIQSSFFPTQYSNHIFFQIHVAVLEISLPISMHTTFLCWNLGKEAHALMIQKYCFIFTPSCINILLKGFAWSYLQLLPSLWCSNPFINFPALQQTELLFPHFYNGEVMKSFNFPGKNKNCFCTCKQLREMITDELWTQGERKKGVRELQSF